MSRTVHEIADDLATAQLFVEAAEERFGQAAREETDARAKMDEAMTMRDRLRLELRAALREAGDVWGNPGVEVAPIQADGYPLGWPRCAGGCNRPALDGKATCGDALCGTKPDRSPQSWTDEDPDAPADWRGR